MKADHPGFTAAVEIEHAKGLLEMALARLEEREFANAFSYINTAMKGLLTAQAALITPTNHQFHALVKKSEEQGQ